MVAALAPALDRVVCTELPAAALEGHGRPGARSRPAAELAALCEAGRAAGRGRAGLRGGPAPGAASWPRPPEGVLLVAGSHYAIGPARARSVADLTVRGFAHGSTAAPAPNCSR